MLPHVLIIFHPRFEDSAEILKGVTHCQRTHRGWTTLLYDEARAGADPCCWIRSRRWDGVLSRHPRPEVADTCRRLRIPVIDLAGTAPVTGVSMIRPDDGEIGRMGASYFLARRFQHFGFCGYANHDWSTARRDGFLAALARARHKCAVFEVERPDEITPAWDAKQVTVVAAWLRCLPAGTAVMACNDFRAQQVVRAAREAGLRVPDEIAVLGANNDFLQCELSEPSLSSVAINGFEMGRRAAEHLDRTMAGGKPEVIDVRIPPAGVVTRKSTDVMALRDKDVALALSFIREHACEGITVDQVLRQVSISRSHLEHKLRRYLGCSPQVEIRRVQIARACELLAETNLPLKDIAEQTGFSHVEYLSVVFKRLTGDTPGRYRSKNARTYEYPQAVA